MRARLMIRYILGEMIPSFFLGVVVFVFILLMFQVLRLTEFVLIHGVNLTVIAQMMVYLSTSFLPILFPMSLLFAVLLTYSRLSADSEVVAFRAIGLNMPSILSPAVILSLLVGVLSLQTSFHIAPWGNREFEVLITKVGAMKPAITLKEGTFSEGFFDLVVYTNKVDSSLGKMSQVFIYDESQKDNPVTIIAREGWLQQDPEHAGHRASLRLVDGSLHRTSEDRHTKIDFATYDIFLSDPVKEAFRSKSLSSLTLNELREGLASADLPADEKAKLTSELHKRIAIAFACILFALIGVGLGTETNRRNAKGGGAVICVGLIVIYWVLYLTAEGAARKGQLPPEVAVWIPNMIFSGAAFFSLRRSWQ